MIDEIMEGQVSLFDRDGLYGKMSSVLSAQEEKKTENLSKEKTSDVSSKKSQVSSMKMPLFLDLRTENGHQPDASFSMGGPLLGEYTIASFGAAPSEENASHLSQILEETSPAKYCLSEKACRGIINRASKRGKELPPILKEALENQINDSEISDSQD